MDNAIRRMAGVDFPSSPSATAATWRRRSPARADSDFADACEVFTRTVEGA